MPQIPPEDIEYLRKQGWTDDEIANAQQVPTTTKPSGVSIPQTIGRTTVANAGGIVGGGGGFLAGASPVLPWNAAAMVAAPETGGLSLAVPLISGLAGSIAGGYGGQKLQNILQGEETTTRLQQAAQEAEQHHPYIALGTQIGEGALASGGMINPASTIRGIRGIIPAIAGRGLSRETANIAAQAAINPAIGNAVSLAQGQGLLSPREDVFQALGGVAFPEVSALGRLGHRPEMIRPQVEMPTTEPQLQAEQSVGEVTPTPVGRHVAEQFELPIEQQNQLADEENSDSAILGRSEPIPTEPTPTPTTLPSDIYKKLVDLDYTRAEIGTMSPKQADDILKFDESNRGGRKVNTAPDNGLERALQTSVDIYGVKTREGYNKYINSKASGEPTTKIQNHLGDLTGKSLYHETSLDNAYRVYDGLKRPFKQSWTQFFTSNNPDLAIGQSGKGILFELNPTRLNGYEHYKPGTSDTVGKEYSIDKSIGGSVKSITFSNARQLEAFKKRFPNSLDYDKPEQVERGIKIPTKNKVVNTIGDDYTQYQQLVTSLKGKGMDEAIPIQKQIEEIKNRNGGQVPTKPIDHGAPLPPDVQQHIVSNKATTGSVLDSISKSQHPYSELAGELLRTSDQKSLGTPWQAYTGRSHYSVGEDHVKIGHEDSSNAGVVIEEAIHSLTSGKLPSFKEVGPKHAQELVMYTHQSDANPAVKDLIGAYLDTANALGIYEPLFNGRKVAGEKIESPTVGNPDKTIEKGLPYAMGNLDEFIAQAFKNPEFQKQLDSIKTSDGRTVWQRIVDAVKRLFGLSPQAGSMLERVLRSSSELVSQERPETPGLEHEIFAQEKESNKPENLSHYRRSFFSFLSSRFDKIAHTLRSPTADYVTGGLHKFAGEMDLLLGRFGNKMVGAIKDATTALSPERITKVHQYLHQMDDNGTSDIHLTPSEKHLANTITDILKEMRVLQNTVGLKVKGGEDYRAGGIKPTGYLPNSIDPKVVNEWATKPESEASKAYNKAYAEHVLGKLREENMTKPLSEQLTDLELQDQSVKTLQDYKQGLEGRKEMGAEFRALRRPEGFGLPWELTDQNLGSNLYRYSKRYAKDVAYFKHIQNDPKMLAALDLRDQFGKRPPMKKTGGFTSIAGNPAVKAAMRSVDGVDSTVDNPVINTLARAINNSVMGIGTSARNILNIPSFLAGYVQLPQLPLVFKAMADYNSATTEAFQSNATKTNYKDFDAAGQYTKSQNPFVNLLDNYSAFMRKWQGRDFSDHFEGQFYYAVGKKLAGDNIVRARSGNKESLRQLSEMGDLVDGGGLSLLHREATEDDISRIAKRYVDHARGTYNAEGLPTWALEGPLAPFTALSRFSIEKANTIYKDVVAPMKAGIYAPLMRYTLASLGVGIATEELNQLLSGKRGADPTTNEVLQQGNPEDYFAKAIGLLQLSSYAGFMGDSLKLAANAAQNKSLKFNQPLSFPLWTFATDTIAGNISDALSAMQQGEDPFDVMGQLVGDIAQQSLQTYRYIDANLVNPKDTERKEKFRDVTVYKQLVEGQPPDPTTTSNPFVNSDIKQFKRTQDVGEAMDLLPSILKRAIEKSNGDPYELARQLRGLKANSYQTFPSLEHSPLAFNRYITFLSKTQGVDAARDRLFDYVKQSEVNKVKSEAVP